MTPSLNRRRWGLLVPLLALSGTVPLVMAQAPSVPEAPVEVKATLPQARLQGQGRLRFMGLRVYEARLWVPAGQRVRSEALAEQAMALEIRYQRALDGAQIAERSLAEMQRQGDIDSASSQRWLQAMKGLFPNVSDGTRITGLHLPRTGALFFVDGKLQGEINDPEFARRFFGIWLAPQSSDARLRAALLGLEGPQAGS